MTSDDAPAPGRLRRQPPPFRRVRVRSTELLTPRMLRVVLAGDELEGFAIPSPASSVRLLLPPPGADTIVMPTWSGNQFELPDGSRAPIRTFTPRYFDAAENALTIDRVGINVRAKPLVVFTSHGVLSRDGIGLLLIGGLAHTRPRRDTSLRTIL